MRLIRILRGCAIALATVGVALPHVSTACGAEIVRSQIAAKSAAAVADVALGQGGVLRGQVVSAQGAPAAGVIVSVLKEGQEVSRVKTDRDGHFAVAPLAGGTYLVATEGAAGPVRAWAHRTAPPAASEGLLLVPAGDTALGQLPGGGLLTNPGFLVAAAIVGVITIVAIEQASGS